MESLGNSNLSEENPKRHPGENYTRREYDTLRETLKDFGVDVDSEDENPSGKVTEEKLKKKLKEALEKKRE